MNDRFKFRMWDEKHNSMCYPGIDWIIEQDCKTPGALTLNRCAGLMHTLMQCTGLKDKNGKLIYEGDIVHDHCIDYITVVEWRKAEYGLKSKYGYIGFNTPEQEVIGNIYENKELLDG